VSLLLTPYLLIALLWAALLAALAYFRRWWTLLILNVVPIGATVYLFIAGGRMGANEDTDQAAVGVMIMAGFCMFAVAFSLAASAIGGISGLIARHFFARHVNIQQESQ
jgi:hypothetical protein